MAKDAVAEAQIPEIRFRPSPEVYAKAARIADTLGLTVTDVARMGLMQIANAKELRLVQPEPHQALRDMPVYGATVDRLARIGAAAGQAAYASHVQAGRLEPEAEPDRKPKAKR
jgi:antitoxin component of RelBE/YafQ-DinJ toxin-antitoxin module